MDITGAAYVLYVCPMFTIDGIGGRDHRLIFQATEHPIIWSFELGGDCEWSYFHNTMI